VPHGPVHPDRPSVFDAGQISVYRDHHASQGRPAPTIALDPKQ
jgi:hypothetical protein